MALRPGEQRLVDPIYQSASAVGEPVPVGWGPAPFKPSQPRGAVNVSRRILLPGADFPPPDAVPVDTIQDADVAPLASVTIITFKIPDTLTLRVDGIGFGADDETALRLLSWQVTATPPGNAVTPYANVPAGIGTIQQPSLVVIVLGSSAIVSLIVTNNAGVLGNTYHYYARLKGWYYAEREATA